MRWPFQSSRSVIGIDACGRAMSAVQLGRRGGGWRLEAVTSIARRDPVAPIDGDEMSELAEVLDRAGFEGRDVALAFPPERLISDLVDMPAGAGRDAAEAAVRADLARLNQIDADQLSVDWWSVPGNGGGASTAMAVACTKDHANALLDAVESAGFAVVGLDAACCALARACAPEFPAGTALHAIFAINAGTADLVVMRGDQIVYQRVLAESGLNKLFAAMLNQLDLDEDVAQLLLHDVGLGPVPGDFEVGTELIEDMRAQVETFAERIVAELRRSFTYASQEHDDEPVRQLLLAGDGASVRGLSGCITEALELPVRTVTPESLVECPRSSAVPCHSPALVMATGLAQYSRRP